MNRDARPAVRRSVHKAQMEKYHADTLKYYEDRRMGKIEGKPFEEWGEPISEKEALKLYEMETNKVQRAFFAVDYSHGFTGRGGKSICCAHDVWLYAYHNVVLPESLERPDLVGPRNETPGEVISPLGESEHVEIDRPLWKASDARKVAPSGESRDDEDVGPLGESRDDEDVGPLGESRDEEEVDSWENSSDEDDDGLREGHEEKEEVASPEDIDELLQLAATSVSMVSGMHTNRSDASSSHAITTLPTGTQEPLTSSPPPIAPTVSKPSRKRGRDSEYDAEEEESPSQQKRMRMDDILGLVRKDVKSAEEEESLSQQKRMRMDNVLGIVRKDVKSAEVTRNVEPGMTSDRQRGTKRARSLEDDSEDVLTKPTPKRVRLHLQVKEISDDDEEYITAGQGDIAKDDDSSLVHQGFPSNEAPEQAMVGEATTNANAHEQSSVELFLNDEIEERDDGFADDEASPTETEWDTAHGINSICANIPIPGMVVIDVTGVWRYLYLPTSTGLPNRAWTEEEKEDLRVYIQDYGVEDWALLSQSTNRPETDLQSMYLEVITARNKQAGRPDRACTTQAYPDLAPPPPPVPAVAPAPEEPRKLRTHDQKGKAKKNRLGDLTYDLKATSFPKVTRDGGMIDSKGNVLFGIMGDISCATKRQQPKPRHEDPMGLPPAENSDNDVADEADKEDSDSEIEEEGMIDSTEQDREQAPSPESVSKKDGPLNTIAEEEDDPEIKQEEDSDQEQRAPAPTAPKPPNYVLGPKFAGVSKLSGSSRRGVPRKAARLLRSSPA